MALGFDFAGVSGASDSTYDAFLYHGFDDSSLMGEKAASALGKANFSKAFHEVVSLIMSFFLHAKPSSSSSSSSSESFPWVDIFGVSNRRDPRIFLTLFGKLSSVLKEVSEKFHKVTDNKAAASTALLRWGDVYRLGDFDAFHRAFKVNKSFSWLLDKAVSSSRYVALSVDDTARLETCIRSLIESQSFSLWALATKFEFLKDIKCVPEDDVFHQLVASMTMVLNSQAKATFSAARRLFSSRCGVSHSYRIF